MGLFSPGFVQGLATGQQGGDIAANSAIRVLEAEAARQQVDQQRFAQSGNQVWAKAIAKLLTGGASLPPGQQQPPAAAGGTANPPVAQPSALPGQTTPAGMQPVYGGNPTNANVAAAYGSPLRQAIVGQESGGNPNAPPSTSGAIGMFQIMPDTFKQYAKPGEDINNPADNAAVGQRILDDLEQKYPDDPDRQAVAYYSGEGNVAPDGSPTPWKVDISKDKDGNPIKPVSQYVADIRNRMEASQVAPGLDGTAVGGYSPTIKMLGGTPPSAVPTPQQATPPDTLAQYKMPGGGLDAAAILQQIQKDNPDMDPGVLSAIVNDHILPLMDSQQQQKYLFAKQQLQIDKASAGMRDKYNELIFKYQRLEAQQAMAGQNLALKAQAQQQMNDTRQQLADLRQQALEEKRQKDAADEQHKQVLDEQRKAQAEKAKVQTEKTASGMPTGGVKFQQAKADLTTLKQQIGAAYLAVQQNPSVAGAVGMGRRAVEGVGGYIPGVNVGAEGMKFQQDIRTIQDAIHGLRQKGYLSKANLDRLDEEVRGLGLLDNPTVTQSSLKKLYDDVNMMLSNLPAASGMKPSDTQVVPEGEGTGQASGGSAAAPTDTSNLPRVKSVADWSKLKVGDWYIPPGSDKPIQKTQAAVDAAQ